MLQWMVHTLSNWCRAGWQLLRHHGTGGVNGNGTVFRVTANGVYTVLYAFQGSPDGQIHRQSLLASDGNFYGTTARGGSYGGGTVFRVSSTGVFTLLYTFTGERTAGFPNGE